MFPFIVHWVTSFMWKLLLVCLLTQLFFVRENPFNLKWVWGLQFRQLNTCWMWMICSCFMHYLPLFLLQASWRMMPFRCFPLLLWRHPCLMFGADLAGKVTAGCPYLQCLLPRPAAATTAAAATVIVIVIKWKQSAAHPHTAGYSWTKEDYLYWYT